MIQIRRLTAIGAQLDSLCGLLIDAVDGGASVGFLAPLSMQTAAAYWRTLDAALASGFILFVAEEDDAVVGAVQLVPIAKENGRHRAEVQKLFVLRSHRGRGIGTLLMAAAEDYARSKGRTLLVLDTHEGSPAEAMYAHWGWQRVGVIPSYAVSTDGALHNTAFYYKELGPHLVG